ncbi:DMT family transporter [Actinomadura rupiterrae]|uniref:DMT family transporter n=1 Tax=Actinomadura rupiterrae TaxID=559627 RepID=UPI0020A50D52|nr:DMT family transporter [Actinomadura rupiterrae]MCP2336708.1 drug/metabolite transporter (DMT)-like permease [Actinomadura rupiterrae]
MTFSANTRGAAQAALAMSLVGSLTAVSATIADFPVLGGQAVRYAGAAAILFGIARLDDRRSGRAPVRPSRRDLALLAALAATGLAAFNVFIILATHDTSPATIGTVVATVPIVLALVGPLLSGRRPTAATVLAACVVASGAGLANGLGGGTVRGLLLSLGALGGEVCFSLLAVPLLPRLGPIRVSAWSAALAVPMLLGSGLIMDGRHVLRMPTGAELAGLIYLTVVVTCVAFLLWYDALGVMGADRAGLFAGMIPVAAVLTTVVLGVAAPRPAEVAGAALVAVGVALGLRPVRGPEARLNTA